MALVRRRLETHRNHMGVISAISRLSDFDTVYVRLALATGFLGAVSDRLGLWGPYGTPNVAWGDMQHFLTYAAKLNPWFPQGIIPFVGAIVTIIESTLGIGLLLGFHTRRAAQFSGWLVLAFGIGMTVGTGFKSALNASVFAFSGGAWLLARAREYPMSVDALRGASPVGSTASVRRGTPSEH
jgi:uncharacterized membrane protein YphA (DoxX/SURF4 family)